MEYHEVIRAYVNDLEAQLLFWNWELDAWKRHNGKTHHKEAMIQNIKVGMKHIFGTLYSLKSRNQLSWNDIRSVIHKWETTKKTLRTAIEPKGSLKFGCDAYHIENFQKEKNMADKSKKHADNAPDPFYVDEECTACEVCVGEAPGHFKMAEDGSHAIVFKPPQNDGEKEKCRSALEGCPVEAIGNDGE